MGWRITGFFGGTMGWITGFFGGAITGWIRTEFFGGFIGLRDGMGDNLGMISGWVIISE